MSENQYLDNDEYEEEYDALDRPQRRSRDRNDREDREDREDRPNRRRGAGGGGRSRRRRKEDYFVVNETVPNYKDVDTLRRFITDRAKIRPRRQTGLSAKNQRKLAQAVKRARHMALLPFTDEQTRR